MLSNKEREKLISAHEKGYKSKDLSEIFRISVSSVNRMIRQKKVTGSCELKTHNYGRKASLSKMELKQISELVQKYCDITVDEVIEKLSLKVSNETVRKAIIKMGYVYKKKSLHATERERLRCGSEKGAVGRRFKIT